MTGAMSRDPKGAGPAEISLVLRSFRRDLADLVSQARAYALDDAEIRDLLEEALEARYCAGPADWRQAIEEEPCEGFAEPGSDYCPSHDPDRL